VREMKRKIDDKRRSQEISRSRSLGSLSIQLKAKELGLPLLLGKELH
jgi:hypothetical protein